MRRVGQSRWGTAGVYVLLVIASFIAVFPLLWVVTSSFKTSTELAQNPLQPFSSSPTLEHYRTVVTEIGFLGNLRNSLLIATCSTLIAVLVSLLGAYGIVRFFPRVGRQLTKLLISTYMFPPILLAIPYTITMVRLGLMNSYAGLVIAYLSFSIPYAIWMLIGFFQTVPIGIEEAAAVDGASRLRVFWQISVPVILPGIVATAVYTFINTFNEFLYALLFITDSDKMPVAVGLYSLQGSEVLDWGAMMAASVIVIVPSVVFFMLIQRHIAGGLSEGSVK
ncbi:MULTISPECIES: carbohydrate ABC transporter permease [unclassified Actinomyces]|uniref:carbohydrate ABC transporter permease n=1 Tax=unclassified Actinomyces TaxID=2609248 RepID=UPI0020177C72|nr:MULTISPECIES: carbohydrate ABC transporter permease [unclassified Actinomyces]MCL3776770.1 carbohydrate ABC transporter permease [Actinomyces sp. AC-20-1]MCL3790364.1 carbohydrate ABC transporter permease [Actinomyces sp. 187325]MCL3792666.1 carbohydrate ABC transporter permease [Actinomyces sp. 186855]MCL3795176.1 carbohydrate ABC transporter permease [Actinomyces sp. 217892]